MVRNPKNQVNLTKKHRVCGRSDLWLYTALMDCPYKNKERKVSVVPSTVPGAVSSLPENQPTQCQFPPPKEEAPTMTPNMLPSGNQQYRLLPFPLQTGGKKLPQQQSLITPVAHQNPPPPTSPLAPRTACSLFSNQHFRTDRLPTLTGRRTPLPILGRVHASYGVSNTQYWGCPNLFQTLALVSCNAGALAWNRGKSVNTGELMNRGRGRRSEPILPWNLERVLQESG